MHILVNCTFYSLFYFIFLLIFYLIPSYIYIYSPVLCFIFYFIFLHCPLSGPVLTYISLLIIPCMIVYVTNKQEPWTLNLEMPAQKAIRTADGCLALGYGSVIRGNLEVISQDALLSWFSNLHHLWRAAAERLSLKHFSGVEKKASFYYFCSKIDLNVSLLYWMFDELNIL